MRRCSAAPLISLAGYQPVPTPALVVLKKFLPSKIFLPSKKIKNKNLKLKFKI